MMYRKCKIILDVILNLIATAMPLTVLQLIILPCMAKRMSEDRYGYLLAAVSLVTIVANTLGNSLNNVRLLNSQLYEKEEIVGDFNRLLIIELLVGVLLIIGGFRFLGGDISKITEIFILIFGILIILKEYFIVNFRLQLNYFAVVWNNIFVGIGYVFGYFFFLKTNMWIAPYLIGTLFGCIHALYKNNMINEPITITKLFKNSLHKTCVLCIAGVLSNALSYSDRLIIYPMLGGSTVTIYFAASFLGKIISTAIGPIASVMLSYLAKKDELPRKQFIFISGLASLIGLLGYVLGIILSKPLLFYLYPQWAIEASNYISITTATAMIIMCTNIIRPFVLRYCNINWQIVANIVPFIIYFVFSIMLYKVYGLYGFCLGVLGGNIAKFIICFIIILKKTGKNKVER